MNKTVLLGFVKAISAKKDEKLGVRIVDIKGARSHYNRITKTIVFDVANDKCNPKGVDTTFYHELGHHVDWELGLPSHSDSFRICLTRELRSIVDNFKIEDIQEYTKTTPKSNGLSDMLSGYTKNKYRFKYGHSTKYWNTCAEKLPFEAFAHFFEAHMRQDKYKVALYRKYLPMSYQMFLDMIK